MSHQHETLDIALRILRPALRSFVELHMRPVYGDRWEAEARKGPHNERGHRDLDLAALLGAIHGNWTLFTPVLSSAARAYTTELRDIRNRLAHQEAVSEDDAARAIDTAHRLLKCIDAVGEAEQLASLRAGAAPAPPNGLVQIARTDPGGIYTEEDLDFECVWKEGNYLKFKSYDRYSQIVYVKVHMDVAIEDAFGAVFPDPEFDKDEDIK